MNNEPDIQRIKKEILERAINQYETRIADLRNEMNRISIPAR
ncbi:MAG TPA: hypothetical protein PLG55_11505 [Methanospirillum sp.]|jgi:predicted component of type VI protein secretion system|nr:hypothetical protein [Methanospirillum sp.]OQB38233.1 MAG: hypothetical protein BWY05_00507 [Euryarchaeota archaeon ADurb.Bin165]HPY61337.1 hypothetical protein [Methanospirillum sp.]HQC00507.1 hypothetical protein [Methanospirillum sp.]